ncbi:MAG: hypothetical protein LAN37_13665 [Acidobacteriia bacterium]|nr:hypothetical protein [Terriglobia bacterium]
MKTVTKRSLLFAIPVLFASLFLPGCNIRNTNSDEKTGKKVDIQSPLGSLHVETDEHVKVHDTGLPVYPGARPAPPDAEHDSQSANISMGFAGFGLKVVAAKYESDDAPEKLIEFYRKALTKYGAVTECRGNIDLHVGKDGKKIGCSSSSSDQDKTELGAGDESAQHMVSVRPKGKGTQFGLIYLQTRGKNQQTM